MIPRSDLRSRPKRTLPRTAGAVCHITEAGQRADAITSATLPLERPDEADEDRLNRILWHAMKGHDTAYPSWAVKLGDED